MIPLARKVVDKIEAPKTCRVLSIDGGGIKGVIPATILAAIEKAVGGPLASKFHLVAGTSTGGILASGLAAEIPTPKLLDFYFKDGADIFASSIWTTGAIEGPKYAKAPIEAALKTAFGETKLSELKHDLVCPSYDIQARTDLLFKSWKARGIEEPNPKASDFLLREVARATSAAPTYFPPATATNLDGKAYACIDGGMYANNPALLGFVAARRLMPLATRYLVVSIGTGEVLTPIDPAAAANWGIVGWGPMLLDIIFFSMGDTVDYELDQLSPLVSHLRLQSSLTGANEALDDASDANMKALAACGARTLAQRKAEIDALVAELKTPLPSRVALGYPKVGGVARPPVVGQFNMTKIKASAAVGSVAASIASVVKPTAAAATATTGVTPSTAAAATSSPATPTFRWRIGGAIAGALTGAALGGPVGAAVGTMVGYLGGSRVDT
jgi:uncharacterized protein